MTRTAWLFVFVAVLAFAGIASAEEAPAPPSVQPVIPVTVAPPANGSQPVGAEEAPAFDLLQIFASPQISILPAPTFKSCTLFQCKIPCQVPGCIATCVSLATCECETICH